MMRLLYWAPIPTKPALTRTPTLMSILVLLAYTSVILRIAVYMLKNFVNRWVPSTVVRCGINRPLIAKADVDGKPPSAVL